MCIAPRESSTLSVHLHYRPCEKHIRGQGQKTSFADRCRERTGKASDRDGPRMLESLIELKKRTQMNSRAYLCFPLCFFFSCFGILALRFSARSALTFALGLDQCSYTWRWPKASDPVHSAGGWLSASACLQADFNYILVICQFFDIHLCCGAMLGDMALLWLQCV